MLSLPASLHDTGCSFEGDEGIDEQEMEEVASRFTRPVVSAVKAGVLTSFDCIYHSSNTSLR